MRIIGEDRNWNVPSARSAVFAWRTVLIAAVFFNSGRTTAQAANVTCVPVSAQDNTVPASVIGFVGGFVHRNDIRHSEVQLARRLQARYGDRVEVQIFENRRKAQAKKWIVRWLNDVGHSARAGEPIRQPNIILFGHSWGASAAVYLARELDQESIPVALTVQVDSVRKHGENDSIIPANVAEAVNFYQSKGLIHGRREILAADPSRTKVLGNFHFKYRNQPAECRNYPWYDRLFFNGHTSIECDPRLWSEVEALIESRLTPTSPLQIEIAAQSPGHSSCPDLVLSKPAFAQPGPDTALMTPTQKIQ